MSTIRTCGSARCAASHCVGTSGEISPMTRVLVLACCAARYSMPSCRAKTDGPRRPARKLIRRRPAGPSWRPVMRPLRLVLVSAVLISFLAANDAQARPRLPGIFGAMLGGMGGMIGLHHHRHARAHGH